jgi:hypothetical protein
MKKKNREGKDFFISIINKKRNKVTLILNISYENKKMTTTILALVFFYLTSCFSIISAATMSVDSFSGPPTTNEIKSFISYINSIEPVTWLNTTNMANEYAQGHSGEAIKAMGLMYEITGNKNILDRMLHFVDILLPQRNDILIPPKGHRIAWTGTIAPIWPGNVENPASAGAEQGDSVGHLAYCARLILTKKDLWNMTVDDGDRFHHRSTYLERAKTYLAQANTTISQFLFAYLLDLKDKEHYFFTKASPYKSGESLPWNQQMMISYGLENVAVAYQILGDDAVLVKKYDEIVQANLQWFWSVVQRKTKNNKPIYDWGYSPDQRGVEDSNHGSLDIAGFSRAYILNRYNITDAMMIPFANTLVEVMTLSNSTYAGRVDGTSGEGHAASTQYIRSGYLWSAYFVPDHYTKIMAADLTPGGTTGSPNVFSRFEWVKYKRSSSN